MKKTNNTENNAMKLMKPLIYALAITTPLHAQETNEPEKEAELKMVKTPVVICRSGEDLDKMLANRKREKEIRESDGKLEDHEMPKEVHYKWKDLELGRRTIAGTVAITRSNSKTDYVTFYTFDGSKVVFKSGIRPKLDKELRELLKDKSSLPVKMTGNYVQQTVRAGGKKPSSFPTLEYVYSYEIADIDELCKEAKSKGFSEEECNTFRKPFTVIER